MRIKTRPYITSFESGQATQHVVSIVGRAPHHTYYTEQEIGTVDDASKAPVLVGAHIEQSLTQRKFLELAEKHGPEQAQQMLEAGQVNITLPVIPGVTSEGVWENPRFDDPEAWREKHGLKQRVSA